MIELDTIQRHKAVRQVGTLQCAECGRSVARSILLLPHESRIDTTYIFHVACGHMEARGRRGWDVVYPSTAALTYLMLITPEGE